MRSDRTERLLNLVLCLLDSRRPVERARIKLAVGGYADSPSDEAFERMFERDKDELRGMGIPVETVVNVNGEVEGYRIDRETYAMPTLELTGAELAVLGLAARAWTDASLSGSAQSALRKIEASAPTAQVTDRDIPDLLASPVPGDAELPELWRAVRERRVVSFTYRGLGQTDAQVRTVEPWGTANHSGAWYLVGHDRDKDAPRIFRTSRLTGAVEVSGPEGAFEPADEATVRDLVARLAEPPIHGRAVIQVTAGSGGRLRSRAVESSGDRLTVGYADPDSLAAEVAELGSSAVLHEPPEARELVISRLRAVADAHRTIR